MNLEPASQEELAATNAKIRRSRAVVLALILAGFVVMLYIVTIFKFGSDILTERAL